MDSHRPKITQFDQYFSVRSGWAWGRITPILPILAPKQQKGSVSGFGADTLSWVMGNSIFVGRSGAS